MTKRKVLKIAQCKDCSENTFSKIKPYNYYMVKDYIWKLSGMEPDEGMLCISCLEKRLDRKIVRDDLLDCPLNDMNGIKIWLDVRQYILQVDRLMVDSSSPKRILVVRIHLDLPMGSWRNGSAEVR